jgi:amidase
MTAIATRYDALLLPTVAAPAPRGLDSTGDPYFCAPWSFAGMPSIALPSGVDAEGLPLSVQLLGAVFDEARLLSAATWCERVLDFSSAPRL